MTGSRIDAPQPVESRLRMLLAGIAGDAAQVTDLQVSALALSSRDATPGCAFLAVKGTRMHGLAFAADAVARGASAIIYESGEGALSPSLPVPSIGVAGLSARVGEIAARFYGEPSAALEVTAITGTDGKTSTAWILASALRAIGQGAHYIGTLGTGDPTALDVASHTTPDPVSLQRALASARADGARAAVLEASSHALHQRRLAGTRLHAAVLTNVGRDHLDYHGTEAAYAAAKRRLFEESGAAARVLNNDDLLGRAWAAEWPDAWTYALNSDARVTAQDMSFSPAGLAFRLVCDGRSAALRSPLLGRFNISNLLAAGSVLLASGHDIDAVADALSRAGTVPGRMEAFGGGDKKPLVIVDYAHTPQALGQALMSARAHTTGKLWCVFGCGGDRDPGKRPLMGQTAVAVADRIILTDDNPRSESPEDIVEQILSGTGRSAAVEVCHGRAEAIARAVHQAEPGDVVLVAGKGHETDQQYGSVKRRFSDRDCVADLLGEEPRP